VRFRISNDIGEFYQNVEKYLKRLGHKKISSSYIDYYFKKNSNQTWEKVENWNYKQKAVHEAINKSQINTVLDVACNTGWYSLMAANLGKSVVAFDIDEACISTLYNKVREEKLDILPLVIDFTNMRGARTSTYNDKDVLISTSDRFTCDSVLVLGLIHHLVLGYGIELESILKSILSLARFQIVIEFVELNDTKIKSQIDFFPSYAKNKSISSSYSQFNIIKFFNSHNYKVEIFKSDEVTRKILVFTKEFSL
jgi:SAM-dependent methyltransferase